MALEGFEPRPEPRCAPLETTPEELLEQYQPDRRRYTSYPTHELQEHNAATGLSGPARTAYFSIPEAGSPSFLRWPRRFGAGVVIPCRLLLSTATELWSMS